MRNEKTEELYTYPYAGVTHHPRMSLENRAAQFAPFAALSGYGEAVAETGRLTEERIELTADSLQEIQKKMHLLLQHAAEHPQVTTVFFAEDERKQGGRYEKTGGRTAAVDPEERILVFEDGRRIRMEDIVRLESPLFDDYGF